jgi:hypothetical protein
VIEGKQHVARRSIIGKRISRGHLHTGIPYPVQCSLAGMPLSSTTEDSPASAKLSVPPACAVRHEERFHPVATRHHPPAMQRTKVRRRVLACARCRKRKLSVLLCNLASYPFSY